MKRHRYIRHYCRLLPLFFLSFILLSQVYGSLAAAQDEILIPDNCYIELVGDENKTYYVLRIKNGSYSYSDRGTGDQLQQEAYPGFEWWHSGTGNIINGNQLEGTQSFGNNIGVTSSGKWFIYFSSDNTYRNEVSTDLFYDGVFKTSWGEVISGTWRLLSEEEATQLMQEQGTSPGITADPSGNDTASPGISGDPTGPALTGPGSDSPISDAALPLAVGAAALVTALSTLGLIFSDGTTPAEAFGELKELFTPNREEAQSLPQDQPADGRDPQEILSGPRFHDQVTDVNGKQWVYYHRPGDEAGDGWTSLDEYNQTKAKEKENKIWTDRYGWQTKAELYNSEQMAEKFTADNRAATVKFNEELKAQPTPPPAELPPAELPSYISGQERERFAAAVKEATQEFEQETDDILKELVASERRHKESVARSDKLGREIELEGKKASFALKLAEDTQKLRKEGYWIRNPNNSYALQIKNRLFSPLDPKGVQCGDLVKLKLEEVKKLAAEKFGEGVLVDMVEIEERTTKAPQGILDYLDSALPYNHQAIRVITPDGESFIVDYWQALHAKGSTSGLMQPENNFTEGWNKSLSGDIVIEGNLQVYQAEQNKLPELIKEHGQQEGLNLWHKQTNTVIQKSDLPLDQKEAQLRKVQTLVNYLGVEGKKIGY